MVFRLLRYQHSCCWRHSNVKAGIQAPGCIAMPDPADCRPCVHPCLAFIARYDGNCTSLCIVYAQRSELRDVYYRATAAAATTIRHWLGLRSETICSSTREVDLGVEGRCLPGSKQKTTGYLRLERIDLHRRISLEANRNKRVWSDGDASAALHRCRARCARGVPRSSPR
jgi:hypothetical protein